jgi:hypothetical protein
MAVALTARLLPHNTAAMMASHDDGLGEVLVDPLVGCARSGRNHPAGRPLPGPAPRVQKLDGSLTGDLSETNRAEKPKGGWPYVLRQAAQALGSRTTEHQLLTRWACPPALASPPQAFSLVGAPRRG